MKRLFHAARSATRMVMNTRPAGRCPFHNWILYIDF